MTALPSSRFDAGKTDAAGRRLLPLLDGFQLGDALTDDVARVVRGGTALRCAEFTRWLAARPEARVVVVAHKNVFEELLGLDFANCQVRRRADGLP